MDTHGPCEMRVVTPNSPGMLRGLCGIPAVKQLAECLTHSGRAGHIRLLPQSQSSLQASPGPDENISFTHTLRCWRAPGKLYPTWVLCLLILLGMNECSEVEGYVEFYLLLKKKKKLCEAPNFCPQLCGSDLWAMQEWRSPTTGMP